MRILPVSPAANQAFSLIMEQRRINFELRYQPLLDRWSLTLSEGGVVFLGAQRLTTGTDLLRPFNFNLGGLFCKDTSGEGVDPGRDDFESRVQLLHVSEAELEAISP